MSGIQYRLSVVIPANNEADVIAAMLERTVAIVRELTDDFEIIVVDDGSEDGTYTAVEQFHNGEPRVKAMRLSRRFGKESALVAGLSVATGDGVITIDADMQHPPDKIPEFVGLWQRGAKIVHGVKVVDLPRNQAYRLVAKAFNRFFSWAAGFDIMGSSDYKLLDSTVARLLVDRFPEQVRFHRGLATWVGFSQSSVPFQVQARVAGKTRWRLHDLVRYGWNTITAFSSLPLKVVPILGVVMLAVSVLLGTEAVISRLRGNAISGFATLEITILFTGSAIMIGLGVIGQYLSRMYDELKRRPTFLVAEQIGFGKATAESRIEPSER